MKTQIVMAIIDEPGIWTARLCRRLNHAAQDITGISYCGKCTEYANQRKRERAEYFGNIPCFVGFDPPHQLHEPCEYVSLSQLQTMLRALERGGGIAGLQRSEIPDKKQSRGWDYATRWYLADSPELHMGMEDFK